MKKVIVITTALILGLTGNSYASISDIESGGNTVASALSSFFGGGTTEVGVRVVVHRVTEQNRLSYDPQSCQFVNEVNNNGTWVVQGPIFTRIVAAPNSMTLQVLLRNNNPEEGPAFIWQSIGTQEGPGLEMRGTGPQQPPQALLGGKWYTITNGIINVP